MSTETYEYEKINAKDKPIAEDFVYVYSEIEDGGFRKVSKAMLKVLLGVATKLSELENDKEFITKTVSDLENYYLKSETYSKDEIDNRISLIPRFDVQVVSSLPTTDISETTVYLVSSGDDSDNLYTEYINVNGLWEILGTQKIASVENAVLYTAQSLTDEQKTQARKNIGAISSEDIPKSLPASDVYSWAKEPEKPSYTASEVGALPDTIKIPTNTSDLTNDSGYITKAVNNLANYYLKSQTYSSEEIDNKISSIPKFSIEVVESLPTSNISTTTVYLLKSGEETDNLYTEYIRVNEKWEYLGKQTVDLTGYVKRTELSSYYTKTEIDSLLETIRNSIPSLIGYAKESYVQEYAQPKGNYATSEELEQLESQIADLILVVTKDDFVEFTKEELATKYKNGTRLIVISYESDNLVPTSISPNGSVFNSCGYLTGYRLDSSGNVIEQENGCITGFIPFIYGKIIRINGALSEPAYGGQYIAVYDQFFELIGIYTLSGLISNASGTSVQIKDNTYEHKVPTGSFVSQTYVNAFSEASYIRVSVNPCIGEDLIVMLEGGNA